MSTFQEKLKNAVVKNESMLCIGLDPDPKLMPIEDIVEFNMAIIDATSDLVCSYKPNLAFYEAMGLKGLEALQKTISFIPSNIPIIGDAKRGDIGSTAQAYATALFRTWEFDAVTVNPFLGKDSVDPFLEYKDKGVFILCHTSNPGASDFQEINMENETKPRPLFEEIAKKSTEWNTNCNVGLVVGATYPEQLKSIRVISPEMPILAPGIGAQGGDLENTIRYGLNTKNEGLIINSSRGIIFASKDKTSFPEEARKAAEKLRNEINLCRP